MLIFNTAFLIMKLILTSCAAGCASDRWLDPKSWYFSLLRFGPDNISVASLTLLLIPEYSLINGKQWALAKRLALPGKSQNICLLMANNGHWRRG